MVIRLKVGDRLPQFEAQDHAGYVVRAADVVGTPLVLYFYPKDGTPGCTAEALAFQKRLDEFDEHQVLVLGVSPDTVESHKSFVEQHKLQFSLLSDPKKTLCKAFGVLKGDKMIRTTCVVNARGVIQWIEQPVELKGHIDRVLVALKEHCSADFSKYKRFEKDYVDHLGGGEDATAKKEAMRKKVMAEYGLSERDLQGK